MKFGERVAGTPTRRLPVHRHGAPPAPHDAQRRVRVEPL